MAQIHTIYYSSPVGILKISATDVAVTELSFVDAEPDAEKNKKLPVCLKTCLKQLDEYFSGQRKDFSVPVLLAGTEFQKNVWERLCTIPYGETQSYGAVARQIKKPKAFRAVGLANNKNKIAIIIPCHRVVGSDGALVGYASGVWRKEWLLKHEKSHV